jgi:hypothetical protein
MMRSCPDGRSRGPINRPARRVKSRCRCLPGIANLRSPISMEDDLSSALQRAERALERIERALASREPAAPARDEELRNKVREVVEELDELIREVAA